MADQGVEALLRDGAGVLPFAAAPSDSGLGDGSAAAAGNTNGAFPINSWSDFVRLAYGGGVKPLFTGDLKSLYSFKLPGQPASGNAASGNAGVTPSPVTGTGTTGSNAAPATPATPASTTGAGGVIVPIIGTSAPAVGKGDCAVSSADSLRALSGYVAGIAPDGFRVISDSGVYLVNYSECTVALADRPNYSIKVGDVVVIKGLAKGSTTIKATQVACVSNQQ